MGCGDMKSSQKHSELSDSNLGKSGTATEADN